jgi:hypothetical protein
MLTACTHVRWNGQTLSVGQGEQFAVIQHGVEVLHPLRVHITVKDDPLALGQLATYVVYDPEWAI